jgi:hypothetical protein
MKSFIFAFTALVISQAAQGAIDIEDRKQTDPLLNIRTWKEDLPPEVDDLFKHIDPTSAEIQHDRVPVSYKRLWGKRDVLMIHAPGRKEHGFIDFSAVTAESKGSLKIYVKNHPYGNHHIKIKLADKLVEDEAIHRGRWEFFKVKFDHQPVVLQIHATQWHYENSFITYTIEE